MTPTTIPFLGNRLFFSWREAGLNHFDRPRGKGGGMTGGGGTHFVFPPIGATQKRWPINNSQLIRKNQKTLLVSLNLTLFFTSTDHSPQYVHVCAHMLLPSQSDAASIGGQGGGMWGGILLPPPTTHF